ncbi:hypothetical protein A2415_04695 [candidate division WWE3 bacterium RIFOXYC1_FULL_39_7]|uniref:Phosphomannomutase n=2 Tax=Katanobacteria TaxID=422282 RepID=A0A1F4X6H5_UNCKA|nr:MAG: hypothetical protein A2415_04695 [candidate division WWE3 bacterium RIFOXYC1_FULL_39_7]OGC77300.1 MAG: hypothetical protein A2619_04655 [candidate division WWE3 bacterium RIFOXYD1_FULL_39_9]
MEINKEIFRAYDIRGVFPDQINNDIAKAIGKGIGTIFQKKSIKNIVIGRDNRPSSYSLCPNLIEGVLSTGCNVTYTGITTQPIIHFLTFLDDFEAGINVTASHNPKKYNGIKIDLNDAQPFYGEALDELYEVVKAGNFINGEGTFREKDYNGIYIDHLAERFSFKNKLKVVVDCGSGATSELAPILMRKLGMDVTDVYCKYDSDFPNEVPDPENPSFLAELKSSVTDNGAILGFGFDGDGDRLGVVDERGTSYSADRLLMLFARDILSKNKGGKIVYDVKCTALLEDVIKQYSGVPEMIKTGRAYVLREVLNGNSVLGGELSGHFYFKDDYFGFDDALYAACRLIDILDRSGKLLSEIMSEFPQAVNTPEIRIPCPDDKKFVFIEEFTKYVKNNASYLKVLDIDGVRVSVSEHGWFLIRASNTSPYLSMRIEGTNSSEVSSIMQDLLKILRNYDYLDLTNLK